MSAADLIAYVTEANVPLPSNAQAYAVECWYTAADMWHTRLGGTLTPPSADVDLPGNLVYSDDVREIVKLTQAEYDNLGPGRPIDVMYVITDVITDGGTP